MIREELEFRIARFADGDLTEAERLAVESELAADAEARAVLAEYQTLRTAIEESAGPALPKVHWDRLEQLLSAAIAKAAIVPANAEGHGAEPGAGDGPFVAATGTETSPLGIEQEFAIACLADGSLAPEQRSEPEQLIASDGRARSLFDQYHDLDASIKAHAYSDPPPVLPWDRLAQQISWAVDAGANAGLSEDVEHQIAGFAEGTLVAEERDAVETRLAADPAVRIMASEYRNLDACLREIPATSPVPAIDWERFARRISSAIDHDTVQAAARSHKPREHAYSLLKWLRAPTRLALAASVLVGVALVARLMHNGGGPVTPSHPVIASTPVEQIAVLTPEHAAGRSQSEISIGPPTVAQAGNEDDSGGDDGVVAHPPKAFVASGRATPGESEALAGMPF